MKTTVEQMLMQKGRDVWTISPNATVMEALKLMAEKNVGALVVTHDDEVVGIISERDYARKVVLRNKASINTKVKEIMTEKVYYVGPKTTAEECMTLTVQQNIRHLPVLKNGDLVGLVSIGDVVKAVIREQETEIGQLSDYISGKYI
ncbi:A-adding tRNA nucleotidyltransferase [Anaerolineales bacterium]|nr:A-adding tRNA nucleotidyltransferase [Anaerolineales bacterium]